MWQNRITKYSEEAPDSLLANPKNWRTHPGTQADALRGVLEDVGVVQNVIANERTGYLIDGHLRVMEALKSGQAIIPVTWVDLSEEEEALVLATLDPLGSMAGTDAAQLDDLLRSVSTDNPALAQMLDALATEAGIVPAAQTDDETPIAIDESSPTRCQPGDVWQVGRHTVACLDSTDRANIKRLLAGRKVAMVWADAPYGIEIVGGLGTVGGSKPFGDEPVRGTDGASKIVKANQYAPVVGDESTVTARAAVVLYLELYSYALQVWWGANHFSDAFPPSPCWIVWDKENTGNFADAELAWCSDDSAVRIFRHQWNGMLRASEHGRRIHPTQKPIALCAWAFEKYGKPDDLILDPFLGSGPSLKAAEQSGRTVIGFELSPHYVDHILEWAEAHGLSANLISPMVLK